ncbi:glycosyltransferase family 2 protein [Telluribacter sp.]|jgi:glycosyltransferase involved in cell wall biosynthesis|uniref:glycosyltransferase family 2 protein n=1 Tax=Telluribacter sp. TaxID=1978767 RepID=UPI002E0D1465|nr:glycosyltransferase [Telluribacter sp.]
MSIKYSIIICTYNRASFLKETIDSILFHLTDTAKYELLIVDNNSTDQTADVVRQYAEVPVVRYIFEKNQGLSYARNRGIQEAQYPVIVFLDDDIEIHPRYLAVLDSQYQDSSVHIVGGKVLPFESQVPDWLPKKYFYLASVYDAGENRMIVPKLMGANHSFRKEVAVKVGGYNTGIGPLGDFKLGGDENEFLLRAQKKGYQLLYHPDLIVYHKIQNRFNKEFILTYSYNIGATEANIDYSHRPLFLNLRILKYRMENLLDKLQSTIAPTSDFVKVFRREHRKGYLNFIKKQSRK